MKKWGLSKAVFLTFSFFIFNSSFLISHETKKLVKAI